MGVRGYDRLSAFDATFLALEDANVHMHVGAVTTFDAGPLTDDAGRLEVDAIRDVVERALASTPRFRQKLADVPVFAHPVWVDDERFNLAYHVRHAALPAPGDERQLKRLAGRILSQKLDRGRPLWEVWVIEGLDQHRFALVAKAHHCMVDGIAGLDLITAMLQLEPGRPTHEPDEWSPRPTVSGARLFSDEVRHRAALPLSLLKTGGRLLTEPQEVAQGVGRSLRGVGEILRAGLDRATESPLNQAVGPFRRFDWVSTPLEEISEIRARFGGTINDVALATAAGTIRDHLRRHGQPLDNESFRVQVPMSTRSADEEGVVGNRVALLIAPLPVAEPDPVERLRRVCEITSEVKQSNQQIGLDTIGQVSDRVFPELLVALGRLSIRQRSFNVVITNVPGPREPVYLLESQMGDIYPLVPLASNQSLGIALFSYHGKLQWGFHGDWDAVPDLHDLVEGVDRHFTALRDRARAA